MSTFKNFMGVLLLTLISFNCKNKNTPDVKSIDVETAAETATSVDPTAKYAKAEFTIEGMTCAIGCAKTIERKIAGMDGVKSATVDFNRKLAMVEYNEAKVTPNYLIETVGKAGDAYKVSNMKNVEKFSTNKQENSTNCNVECTKKAEGCNANCTNKTDAKKMACDKDCDKPCCANKTNA